MKVRIRQLSFARKLLQELWPNILVMALMTFVTLGVSANNLPEKLLNQQEGIKIAGKVTGSEDNQGLPGVNILVKGTATGTITDISGNYTIEVPDENAVLEFRYIGYMTEEYTVGILRTIDVQLEPDVLSLSEIVVGGDAWERQKSGAGGSGGREERGGRSG